MSIKTRSLIFATFFGSVIVLGFLVAALTTDYWIYAEAKRHTNGTIAKEPSGKVNFGLFMGYKDLNIGYGVRPEYIYVMDFMKSEPDSMNYYLWLGAALGVGFGLLASAIAAIASVLKSASLSEKRGTLILLFISNVASENKAIRRDRTTGIDRLSKCFNKRGSENSPRSVDRHDVDDGSTRLTSYCALVVAYKVNLRMSPNMHAKNTLSQILAFICWLVQFYQYLTHNVLTAYDRDIHWYSHGLASLGHSFYFVIVGIIFVFINLTLLIIAVRMERRERLKSMHDDPAYDEKAQGAIMLY
ncbi:hypothetical protein Bhyg_01974 [Pseudolycoriella hygida]|uniref:Uncharacterized protein n=1 Tax=Pseudolycoriella hygida TaxID=35572 RepID=A0A9Q0S7Y1_9DIPT|nr:hypothetical protein Bhyg_01974 [Pseudolycoriella hygida]